jgi:hypothetical protein
MTVVTRLNENLEFNLLSFPNLNTTSLPLAFIKYQKLEKVVDILPQGVQEIISCMLPLFTQRTGKCKILVDYKVRDLRKGEAGCPLSGWHLDFTKNPNDSRSSEEHLIFSTHQGTEFITTPMEVNPLDKCFSEVLARNSGYDFTAAKPSTVTRYGRLNLHRSPVMQEDCRRVVLRLTRVYL